VDHLLAERLRQAAAICVPVRWSPAIPTVLPTNADPRLKIPYAHRPMSSAAIPGSFLSAMGRTKVSVPSGPFFGPMPKWIRLSQ
jgi:hypothetical protein